MATEELTEQRDLIQKKITFFKESLPVLEAQKGDFEQQETKLRTELSLEADSKVQATLQKSLLKVEEGLTLISKHISETISTMTGLEVRLAEVEKSIRVSEKAGHEEKYHEVKERLLKLPGEIEVALDALKEPVARLTLWAEEYYKLQDDFNVIYNSFDAFLKSEGLTEVSENVSVESLTRDNEEFQALKKEMLILAGKIIDFDINKTNLRRVVMLLGGG